MRGMLRTPRPYVQPYANKNSNTAGMSNQWEGVYLSNTGHGRYQVFQKFFKPLLCHEKSCMNWQKAVKRSRMPYFDSLLFENSLNPIKLEFWILLWEISYIINFWAWNFPWFITQHFVDISNKIFFCCKKNLIGMERHWSQHKTYRWLLVGRSTTNVIGFDWIKNCWYLHLFFTKNIAIAKLFSLSSVAAN